MVRMAKTESAEQLSRFQYLDKATSFTQESSIKISPSTSAFATRADIAIVGMGCRFPGGVRCPESLWNTLLAGEDCVSEITADRWAVEQHYHPRSGTAGKSATRWAGLIDDIDRFDCEAFGISPREASSMDPQQRMLLEVAWETFENGGYLPSAIRKKPVGVFVGGFTLDYMLLQLGGMDLRGVEPHTATGSMMTLLANRLSYVFDLTGPSFVIDTACSSSLVALHQACQSLSSGECSMALAGGVNALLTPSYTVAESRAGMLSPTGRSKAFDASADGYTRGEGAALVLLKPLEEAERDGDLIYSVIRATATNHDGLNSGITVPNGNAQMALMRGALEAADLKPRDITFTEAHGTGTPVGDPIEARAIGTVMGEGRDEDSRCFLGSIKTNIGHTEACAGVAGLMKAALSLHYRTVPQHLHLKSVNPDIHLNSLKLEIPTQTVKLDTTNKLFGCVNSFGFGGANANAILETYTPGVHKSEETKQIEAPSVWTLPLSSWHQESLGETAKLFAGYLSEEELSDDDESGFLANICYTAVHHRESLPVKACVLGQDRRQLVRALEKLSEVANKKEKVDYFGEDVVVQSSIDIGAEGRVFVYTGMGPQWWAMGHQLYREDKVFKRALDYVLGEFDKLGKDLRSEWFVDESANSMRHTKVAQPSNFALQVALTMWLAHHGVKPSAVVGHSAGEPAAAWAAGALSLEDAVLVTFTRSRLQQTTSGQGAMMAVGLGEQDALDAIARLGKDGLSLAAINSPESVTMVGPIDSIVAMQELLESEGRFARRLQVEVPYHSKFMDPLREKLIAALNQLKPHETAVPMVSTVTGEVVMGSELDGAYWWENVRQPVRFADATKTLRALFPAAHWLEIGPHPVLAQSLTDTAASEESVPESIELRCWCTLSRKQDETLALNRMLASLYMQGHSIEWPSVNSNGAFTRLPCRSWRDRRFWHEMPQSRSKRIGKPHHPLLSSRVDTPVPTWEMDLLAPRLSYLDDHCLQGVTVFPGAGYVSMAMHAARSLYNGLDAVAFVDINFERALYINRDEFKTVRLVIDPGTHQFSIASRLVSEESDTWEQHCSGRLLLRQNIKCTTVEIGQIRERCPDVIAPETCYQQFRQLGLEYGSAFQGIDTLFQGKREALAKLVVPEGILDQLPDYDVHPAVLDVCFQTLAAALPFEDNGDIVYMPTGVGEGRWFGKPGPVMWVHAAIDQHSYDGLIGQIRLYDDEGRTLIEIDNCTAIALGGESSGYMAPRLYAPQWVENPLDMRSVGNTETRLGQWLVYGGSISLRNAVAQNLIDAKCQVINLESDAFDPLSKSAWIDQLRGAGKSLCGLISIGSDAPSNDPDLDIEQGCLITLALLQALSETAELRSAQNPLRLWLVSRATQAVAGHELVYPYSAALWGMGRIIGHAEHVGLWGGMIDLPSTVGKESESSFDEARFIVQECLVNGKGHDEIALRDSKRYTSSLSELPVQSRLPSAPVIRSNRTIIITGGLGGLGLATAKWLVRCGARHLLLLGRENLPPRDSWFDGSHSETVAARIDAVRSLELSGAQVYVDAADVSDATALQNLLQRHADAHRPKISGVIHSAGVAKPKLLVETSAEEFLSSFPAKLKGAVNLHNALLGTPLDFFVLYSSVAAQVVSMGQGNYAAANAALDAFAHWRQAQGLPAVSIGWGPWAQVGMATQLDLTRFFEDRGLFPMSTAQGTEALGELLSGRAPHAVVLGARWQKVAESSPLSIAAPLIRELVAIEAHEDGGEAGSSGSVSLRQLLQDESDLDARRTVLTNGLRQLICRVLRVPESEFEDDMSFSNGGMDSMMAIEIKNRIEHELMVSVAIVDLLSGATINSLTQQLEVEINQKLQPVDSATEALSDELQNMSVEDALSLLEEVDTQTTGDRKIEAVGEA